MFRLSRRVAPILLLLALVLAGPWPAEAAGGTGAAWAQTWDLAAQIWDALVGLWGENGCSLDPNGPCGSGSQAKNGCSVDPNGRRSCGPAGSAAAALDNGCSLDPSGGCRK